LIWFDADGSTTIYFVPTQPAGVKRGNWVHTMPGNGWFTLLRLYSPLESFPFYSNLGRPSVDPDCPASAPVRHMWTASWQALFSR
jgi:hypothetical protein